MGRESAASLAPGFRFHPTDEELVWYYLKRKVCGKLFRFDTISEIDIYKSEPWDLPGQSKLKSRDLEWYFFSVLDKKYGNGSRTNRATDRGYWKTTGKDREVRHRARTVGMKKTLVYHSGRAPRGERTNWVMHEYRLMDEELKKTGVAQDAFVLCRIFQKSGSGPKNGEQYGAPFVEEEWDEDEDVVVFVPGELAAEEVVAGHEPSDEAVDLEKCLDIGLPPENDPLPLNFYYGDCSKYAEDSREFNENEQKPFIGMEENHCGSELPNDQKIFDLSEQYEVDPKSVKDEYYVEQSNDVNSVEVDYLLDEPYLDASENLAFEDGFFLETDDLSNPVETDPSAFDIDEYLAFLDADGDNLQQMAFGSFEMMGSENPLSDLAPLDQEPVNGGAEKLPIGSEQLSEAYGDSGASSSKKNPEATEFESDIPYPFIKQASYQLLGGIPAPFASASDAPTKDVALRLNSAIQSSSSVHLTAGMIQIRDTTLSGNGVDWSYGKSGNINFMLSFGLPQGEMNSASLEPIASLMPGKAGPVISRAGFYLIFIWVLILSVSYKIGTCICSR